MRLSRGLARVLTSLSALFRSRVAFARACRLRLRLLGLSI